jgi:hypothetical protein
MRRVPTMSTKINNILAEFDDTTRSKLKSVKDEWNQANVVFAATSAALKAAYMEATQPKDGSSRMPSFSTLSTLDKEILSRWAFSGADTSQLERLYNQLGQAFVRSPHTIEEHRVFWDRFDKAVYAGTSTGGSDVGVITLHFYHDWSVAWSNGDYSSLVRDPAAAREFEYLLLLQLDLFCSAFTTNGALNQEALYTTFELFGAGKVAAQPGRKGRMDSVKAWFYWAAFMDWSLEYWFLGSPNYITATKIGEPDYSNALILARGVLVGLYNEALFGQRFKVDGFCSSNYPDPILNNAIRQKFTNLKTPQDVRKALRDVNEFHLKNP